MRRTNLKKKIQIHNPKQERKKHEIFIKSVLLLFGLAMVFGCSTKQLNMSDFTPQQFSGSQYASKVDNFSIIFDASSSMHEKYNHVRKFEIAKTLTCRMNATIPELGQTAGLRSFGHAQAVSTKMTELFYGMETYSSKKLSGGMAKITEPGGNSPLCAALDATQDDLKGLSGKHAVIIISDGAAMPGKVVASAKALKDMYGSRICFYPILVGDDPSGAQQLKQIADIGDCGFFSNAEDIMTSAGMASFVEKVFLDRKKAAPAPVKKVVAPARKDSDGDGVYDDEDKCPGTPAGAKVNAVGCWSLAHVLFDFDKSVIKPAAYPELDEVVAVLKKNPGMNVELDGHTDSMGTMKYNMELSKKRADAVKSYLVAKGIDASRLSTKGFGLTKPIVSNDTKEHRAMNRRVEIQPL